MKTPVHAIQSIETDQPRSRLDRIEEAKRVPIVVYDTDWQEEKIQPISTEYRTSIANARERHPPKIDYEQATIHSPKSVLSRERYERVENLPQEITEQIVHRPRPQDRSIERLETDQTVNSNQTQPTNPQILCHPMSDQLQINDEQTSSFADDSLLVRHQQQPNLHIHESMNLEDPLRSTAFLTLNLAQRNEDRSSSWQQAYDQQFFDRARNQEQHLQIQSDPVSPRYLPSISSTDNYISEFHQAPLLRENVRIENSERIPLVPSTHINQSRPVFRVRQQQISSNDDHDYSTIASIHPDHIDRINTAPTDSSLIPTVHVEPGPVILDIAVRVRPSSSDTSSLADMDAVLNRFEENVEPERHLPLVDQISLSYTTSMQSIQDGTQRAIHRYEQEHPYFSRALPSEWLQPTVFPHDEQLVEQWIVERNLETIQQQVELSTTNELESVAIVVAAVTAIATDAFFVGERFEEEQQSDSFNTKTTDHNLPNHAIALPALISHCSPTSDYETDSLDKDIDTASTTTSVDAGLIVAATPVLIALTTESTEIETSIPMEFFPDTPVMERMQQADTKKDLLLTFGMESLEQKSKPEIFHRAKEDRLESEEILSLFPFEENHQELLNMFFEPAHFHLPIINELSIYQISFHHEYPIDSPLNLSQPTIHNDENLSSNGYHTDEREVYSIAQIHNQSDAEEDPQSLSQNHEPIASLEQEHIQSFERFPETLLVQINEPPTIFKHLDEQSNTNILPDIIPSTIENEVMHGQGVPLCMSIDRMNLFIVNHCRMTPRITLRNFEPLTCF